MVSPGWIFRPGRLEYCRTERDKETHQIVLQGQVELALTGIALTTGTAAQLVVDTAGFVALGAEHVQTAELDDFLMLLSYIKGANNGSDKPADWDWTAFCAVRTPLETLLASIGSPSGMPLAMTRATSWVLNRRIRSSSRDR